MSSEDNIVGNVVKRITSDSSDLYSHAWTIGPLCISSLTETKMASAKFKTGDYNEYTWYLSLDAKYSDIALYLGLIDIRDGEEDDNVPTAYDFSILNQHGKGVCKIVDFDKFEVGDIYGIGNFVSKEEISLQPSEFLPNGQLTILCEMKHYAIVQNLAYKKLRNDMQVLLEDRDHSDAIIVAGGKTFHVHKAILVSRSSWFRAIFNDIMKEERENEIIILPDDCDVAQELLRFIYTSKVNDIEKVADRLFAAAHLYQLDDLKRMCSDVMSNNLNVWNVEAILNLANIYLDIELEKKALAFQTRHARDLGSVEM